MLPLHLPTLIFSRRIFIAAAISTSALFLAGLFLYTANAQSFIRENSLSAAGSVSSGTVYLSASGQPAAVTSTKKAPMLEVHIANNGLMLLRGATVISNSRGTIRVGMVWGSADFTWTVTTDFGTKYLTSKGEKETLEDIKVGDIVTITGMLIESGAEPTINAEHVRE